MSSQKTYEVIVVGGGHAGTEAALASARMGARTLLLTDNIETLGQMSCNPAIGGIGKSHLVKEIDALGGVMAIAADYAGIHVRVLNESKGPAVQATRVQADRFLYKKTIRTALENQENLSIFQDKVVDLLIDQGRCTGVETRLGVRFFSKAVVLTVGTFLRGTIHIGSSRFSGGRSGDGPSVKLAEKMQTYGFETRRLKTGTPPRIDGRTIDYTKCTPQEGLVPPPCLSLFNDTSVHPAQRKCFITHTTDQTMEIIQKNLHKSSMFSGNIEGVGPRYCPSIEDKVHRFSRQHHQVFIEPEGLNVQEVYPNGISTSLPCDVQEAFVRSISGFAQAQITRPGYAIEYDFFDPRGLFHSLETKHVKSLFFAGQINGTTGYEEAGAQGLLAGMNAARCAFEKEGVVIKRHQGYMGVLVDDLVTQGTDEPYRMFTSRSEYRLMLREDNAHLRLMGLGREVGLVSDEKYAQHLKRKDAITVLRKETQTNRIKGASKEGEKVITMFEIDGFEALSWEDLVKRPEVKLSKLGTCLGITLDEEACFTVEADIKYEGYIKRLKEEIKQMEQNADMLIPQDFVYRETQGLSNELVEKLNKVLPQTIAQASRIPGMTPAALSILMVYIKRHQKVSA